MWWVIIFKKTEIVGASARYALVGMLGGLLVASVLSCVQVMARFLLKKLKNVPKRSIGRTHEVPETLLSIRCW
jgi:hypothetical protein